MMNINGFLGKKIQWEAKREFGQGVSWAGVGRGAMAWLQDPPREGTCFLHEADLVLLTWMPERLAGGAHCRSARPSSADT